MQEETPAKSMKRRGILAAAGAVVAGIMTRQTTESVSAYSGGGNQGFLALGSNPWYLANSDGSNTAATASATAVLQATPNFGLYAGQNGADPTVFEVDARTILPGGTVDINAINAYASGRGSGVSGRNDALNGIGVAGVGSNGTGVYGQSSAGAGVWGYAVSGAGVGAVSTNGLGAVLQGGLAPLRLVPGTVAAANLSAAGHQVGELYVTSDDRLFFLTGTAWREIAFVPPNATPQPQPAAAVVQNAPAPAPRPQPSGQTAPGGPNPLPPARP